MYHYAPNLHKDYRSGVETAEKMRALTAVLYAAKERRKTPLFPKDTKTMGGRSKTSYFVDLPSSKSEDSLTSEDK